MTRSLVCLVLTLGVGACDGPLAQEATQEIEDVCTPALEKLEYECGVALDAATKESVTCDEAQRCGAGCVEAASCEEIIVTLQGGINTFSACVDVCAGQPVRQEAPACTAAKNKLTECGLQLSGVCTETDTCFTNCVSTYSCEEINASVTGVQNNFSNCMLTC